MPSIQLGFTASTFIVLALVALAISTALLFYRVTLPPVAPWKRRLLAGLRGLSLALLVMLLFEPLLRFVNTETLQPLLAVLIDNSKSMSIVDRGGDRASILNKTIASPELRRLKGIADVRYFTFGTRLTGLASQPDSLPLTDEASDISSALRSLRLESQQSNLRGILLITDGSYNLGQNPVYEAEQLGIPVYTTGIGDSSDQRDVVIAKVATNDLVYSETEVPVDVMIKSTGYPGQRVDVILSDDGGELARSQVTLGEGTREYPVKLVYTARGEGVKKYTVRVPSLEGELTTNNNRKTFFSRILKSKLQVLIIAGTPGPDLSILRQTIQEENSMVVRSFAQRQSGGFYEGELSDRVIDSTDCVVLINFPTARTSDVLLGKLRSALVQNTMPLFFVDGKQVDEARLRTLAPVLPFTSGSSTQQELLAFLDPSPEQKNNPILQHEADLAAWNRLPPIFRKQTEYRAKTEATVLSTVRLMNVPTAEPLILSRNVNRQKSLAVLGYGLWRWRLMAQGNPDTEGLLSSFLINSIRWLTTREDKNPVRVSPVRDLYVRGERVELIGQVYDASAFPVEQSLLGIKAVSGQEEFQTTLRPIGNGRYEGAFEGLREGDYQFTATASLDGQLLGSDRGRFSVGELDLEFLDTRMNIELLRQIALRTGGSYFAPDNLGEFERELAGFPSFQPQQVRHAGERELWNWPAVLGFIIVLLGVEWFIRKRSGMI